MQHLEPKQLEAKYLESVSQEWENLTIGNKRNPLTVGEIPVRLVDMYVMLQAIERRPSKPEEKRSNSQQDASVSKSFGTSETSNSARNDSKLDQPPFSLPLTNILSEAKHLVLLGEPGAGKSTALQFIGLCFAHRKWAIEKLDINESRIPILLILKDCAERIAASARLENVLAFEITKFLPLNEVDAEKLVLEWQSSNRLLVLLDGLDEVSDNLLASVESKIERYASTDKEQKCHIILSSRPAGFQQGYFAQVKDLRIFTLKPFQRPEDALPYLQKWLMVKGNWDRKLAENEASKLLAEIINRPALSRYLDNPLLLRLAAESYATHGVLASNRGKMYEGYVSKSIWKDIEPSLSTPAQKNIALDAMEELAWQLQSSESLPQRSEKVIADPPNLPLLRHNLRLVEVEDGKFTFSHKTFQEYFLAKRLAKAWRDKKHRIGAWEMLRPRLHDPAWREVLLLLAGMMDKNRAVDLVDKVLKAHSSYESEIFRDLRLAALLLGERSDVNEKDKPVRLVIKRLKKRIVKFNLSFWHRYSAYYLTIEEAAKALSEIGIPAVPTLMQLLSKRYLSDHINGLLEWIIRHYPNALEYLISMINDYKPTSLQTSPIDELTPGEVRKQSRFEQVSNKIQVMGGRLVSLFTGHDGLFARFTRYDDIVLSSVGRAITAIGTSAIPNLEKALNSPSKSIRLRVINTMGQIEDRKVAKAVVPLLEDPDKNIQYAAVLALQSSGNATLAIEALVPMLDDPDEEIRREVAIALGDVGDARAISELVRLIEKSPDYQYRYISSLGKIGVPAIPYVTQLIEQRRFPSKMYAEALGQIDDTSIIPGLLIAYGFHMTSEDGDARKDLRKIIKGAVGKLAVFAIPELIQALQKQGEIMARMDKVLLDMADQNESTYKFLYERAFWAIRSLLIMLLVVSDDENVFPILHQEKDIQSISWAINLLKNENDPRLIRLIPTLFGILEDTKADSSSVLSARNEKMASVLNSLTEIGTQATPFLLERLDYLSRKVHHAFEGWNNTFYDKTEFELANQRILERQGIISALGEIGDRQAVPVLLHLLGKVSQDMAYYASGFDDVSHEFIRTILAEQVTELHLAIAQALDKPFDNTIDRHDNPEHLIAEVERELFGKYSETYRTIVQALGTLGDPQVTLALCVELQGIHLDSYNRVVVAETLGKIGDSRAIPFLQKELKTNIQFYNNSWFEDSFINECIRSLGEIGVAESTRDLLREIIDDSKLQTFHRAALEAIRKNYKNTPDDVYVLREALQNRGDTSRWDAMKTLVKMGDQQAIELLSEEIKNYDSNAVSLAKSEKRVDVILSVLVTGSYFMVYDAIEEMGVDAVPGLIQALENGNPRIRIEAVRHLKKTETQKGNSATNLALKERLNDIDPNVRLESALALGKLGDEEDRRAAAEVLLQAWQSRLSQDFFHNIDYSYGYRDEVVNLLGEFGKDKTAVSLLLELDSFRSGNFMEALTNVINRTTDLGMLRWLARKKILIEIIADRLDILNAPKIADPLYPLGISSWQRMFRYIGIVIVIMLLTGLEGALASAQFQSAIDKFLPFSWLVWVTAHPTRVAIIRTGIFAAIGGLIALFVAIIIDRLIKSRVADQNGTKKVS